MNKRILLLVSFFFLVIGVNAQTAKSSYVNMPDSLNQLLTKVNREDFADFLASKMKAVVQNKFDKKSEMKELTDDYLMVQTTESSTFQMKILPLSDSTRIICAVKTFYGPACDSEVHFYNMKWKEMPASNYITLPSQADFFVSVDTTQEESFIMASSVLTMDLVKADLSSKDQKISFTYTTPETLGRDDLAKLSPFLKKDAVKMEWSKNKGMFVKL